MDIIRQYFPLCWCDASPLELPRSTRFLKNNLIFNFAIIFFIQFNMSDDIESISEVLLETLLTLTFIAAVLCLNKSMYAYTQVTSAILFCENVVAIFLVPIVFWVTVAEDWFSYGVLAFFMLWDWLMIAGVFKNSLAINVLAGLVVSLFYFLVTFGGGFALNTLLAG